MKMDTESLIYIHKPLWVDQLKLFSVVLIKRKIVERMWNGYGVSFIYLKVLITFSDW
jgi:hypothetical protein